MPGMKKNSQNLIDHQRKKVFLYPDWVYPIHWTEVHKIYKCTV